MRYKAMFIAGFAVGFVAGARSGRGTYDKLVAYGRQVAEHPKVQQATEHGPGEGDRAGQDGRRQGARLRQVRRDERYERRQGGVGAGAAVVHAAADKLPRQFGGGTARTTRRTTLRPTGTWSTRPTATRRPRNGVRYTPDAPGGARDQRPPRRAAAKPAAGSRAVRGGATVRSIRRILIWF